LAPISLLQCLGLSVNAMCVGSAMAPTPRNCAIVAAEPEHELPMVFLRLPKGAALELGMDPLPQMAPNAHFHCSASHLMSAVVPLLAVSKCLLAAAIMQDVLDEVLAR
jgi:hypothetical protein